MISEKYAKNYLKDAFLFPPGLRTQTHESFSMQHEVMRLIDEKNSLQNRYREEHQKCIALEQEHSSQMEVSQMFPHFRFDSKI